MTRGNGLPSRSGHGRPAHVCTREQLCKAPLTLGSVIGVVPAGGGFAQDRLHDEKAHHGIHFCGPPHDLGFKIFSQRVFADRPIPAVPHETADMRLRDPQPDQISTARRCSFVASNRGRPRRRVTLPFRCRPKLCARAGDRPEFAKTRIGSTCLLEPWDRLVGARLQQMHQADPPTTCRRFDRLGG